MTRDQAADPAVTYQENHSALTWQLLTWGLLLPAAGEAAFGALAAAGNPLWLLGAAVLPLFVPITIGISLLYRNWPTGIRVDASGITIGAVRSSRAARRTPTVTHQSWGLFTCPWSQLREARIVTDPAELQQLKTSPLYSTLTNRWGTRRMGGSATMAGCKLGVLTAPFMRAAIVIDLEPGMAEISQVRPARYFGNGIGGSLSRLIRPEMSTTWIVPTRHPGDLSAALDAPRHQRGQRPGASTLADRSALGRPDDRQALS